MVSDMMKIIVTGSSGTIGTRLCEMLLKKGHVVTGVDVKPNQWNPEINRVTSISDMRKHEAFDTMPRDADMIIHLAANALVYPLVVDPGKAMDNLMMTFNALEFARKNGIKRFIFGSSREVYGNTEKIEHREDDAMVENSESPYAATKLAAEALIRSYNECYGIGFIVIRFSNVYGMYDSSDRLIPRCISRARKGEQLEVYGRDKMLDFTYIDDAVSGVIAAAERFDKAGNDVFNLATGRGTTILDVVSMINQSMGGKSGIKVTSARPGEVIKYVADISNARKKLGYEPKTGIKEGIEKSIAWYNEHLPDF